MRSLRDHVEDLLRSRLANAAGIKHTVRTRNDRIGGVSIELMQERKGCDPITIAYYRVDHEMRAWRIKGDIVEQTPDSREFGELLRLDIEERVGNWLALLAERGST